VGILKIFLITFVWAYIASVLPAVSLNLFVFSHEVILLFLAHYFFIFSLTLPFDLKDSRVDALNHVKTIPVLIGAVRTRSLTWLLLCISTALHIFLQKTDDAPGRDYSLPLLISNLLTAYFVNKACKNEQNNYFYFGLLDGMILLQFILCVVYSFL
jgi:4-hydroxybenzoate polyprenyltransferase